MKKTIIAFCTIIAMLTSVCIPVFAEDEQKPDGRQYSPYVEFTASDDGAVTAKTFLTGSSDEEAMFILAAYKDGFLVNATTSLNSYQESKVSNRLIKLSLSNEQDYDTLKAFVWDKSSQGNLAKVATYGAKLADVELGITIDGMSMEEYSGMEFNPNVDTYRINLKTGFPVVRGVSSDASIRCAVVTDVTQSKSTIEFSDGTSSKTYTINWSIQEGVLNPVKELTTFTPPNGWSPNINASESVGIKKTSLIVEEGTSFKKFEVNLNESGTGGNNNAMLVIKPKNTSSAKDIVVTQDGAELTWTDDTAVISKDSSGEKCFGEISNEAPVTESSQNHNYKICRAIQNSDDDITTGSRVDEDTNVRNPANLNGEINGFPQELIGCNYIPLSRGIADKILTIYLKESADLYYISRAGSNISTLSAEFTSIANDEFADGFNASYRDAIQYDILENTTHGVYLAANYAWWIKKGIIDGYNDTWFRTDIFTPKYKTIKLLEENGITKLQMFAADTTFAKKYDDIVNGFVPGTTQIGKNTLFTRILPHLLEAEWLTNTSLVTDFKFNYKEKTKDNNVQTPDVLPFTADAELRAPAVDDKWDIVSYPKVMNLEGAYVVNMDSSWRNASSNQYSKDYLNLTGARGDDVTGSTWYSFTISKPAEIMILANNNNAKDKFTSLGWETGDYNEAMLEAKTSASKGGDGVPMSQGGAEQGYGGSGFNIVYTKRCNAGERIEIPIPRVNVLFLTFIRPL